MAQPLTIETIIREADARVENAYGTAQKVSLLNEVNTEFFDVVKIPKIYSFNALNGQSEYTFPAGIVSKSIEKVRIGTAYYDSIQYGPVKSGRNEWAFDDDTLKMTLLPAPVGNGTAVIRYFKEPSSTYLVGSIGTQVPDAPTNYHWLYILGLAERIAKMMDDVGKAQNIGLEYKNNLMVAQQNYQKGG